MFTILHRRVYRRQSLGRFKTFEKLFILQSFKVSIRGFRVWNVNIFWRIISCDFLETFITASGLQIKTETETKTSVSKILFSATLL